MMDLIGISNKVIALAAVIGQYACKIKLKWN